jgi:hypothetical protein
MAYDSTTPLGIDGGMPFGFASGVEAFLARVIPFAFPNQIRRSLADTIGRAAIVCAIAIFSVHYFRVSVHELGEDPGLIHSFHLVFHEAGHAMTAMVTTNRDLIVFMGSGMQVLFPLIVAGAFYWTNSDEVGAALGLWWAGHSMLDVAPYIADARALELQLLSGGTGKEVEGHDWEYLLTRWNALSSDLVIADRVALIARIVMTFALLWAVAGVIYDRFVIPDPSASYDTAVE